MWCDVCKTDHPDDGQPTTWGNALLEAAVDSDGERLFSLLCEMDNPKLEVISRVGKEISAAAEAMKMVHEAHVGEDFGAVGNLMGMLQSLGVSIKDINLN